MMRRRRNARRRRARTRARTRDGRGGRRRMKTSRSSPRGCRAPHPQPRAARAVSPPSRAARICRFRLECARLCGTSGCCHRRRSVHSHYDKVTKTYFAFLSNESLPPRRRRGGRGRETPLRRRVDARRVLCCSVAACFAADRRRRPSSPHKTSSAAALRRASRSSSDTPAPPPPPLEERVSATTNPRSEPYTASNARASASRPSPIASQLPSSPSLPETVPAPGCRLFVPIPVPVPNAAALLASARVAPTCLSSPTLSASVSRANSAASATAPSKVEVGILRVGPRSDALVRGRDGDVAPPHLPREGVRARAQVTLPARRRAHQRPLQLEFASSPFVLCSQRQSSLPRERRSRGTSTRVRPPRARSAR